MPLLNLSELQKVRSSVHAYRTKLTENDVDVLYKLAGGNARMVLEWPTFHGYSNQSIATYLQSKVKGLNDTQLQVAVNMHAYSLGF